MIYSAFAHISAMNTEELNKTTVENAILTVFGQQEVIDQSTDSFWIIHVNKVSTRDFSCMNLKD